MSKFSVTANEINTAISTLTSDNNEFRARVSELEGLQQELASQWTGDANTAFNASFTADKGQWATFATLVDNYISALQNILTTYNQAEATNTSTAKTRTY